MVAHGYKRSSVEAVASVSVALAAVALAGRGRDFAHRAVASSTLVVAVGWTTAEVAGKCRSCSAVPAGRPGRASFAATAHQLGQFTQTNGSWSRGGSCHGIGPGTDRGATRMWGMRSIPSWGSVRGVALVFDPDCTARFDSGRVGLVRVGPDFRGASFRPDSGRPCPCPAVLSAAGVV